MSLLVFSSCEKGENINDDKSKESKDWGDKDKDGDEDICEWDASKVADTEIWEEFIIEPLETSDDCDCIVGGVVKYAKIDANFAYVIYYGKGECDGWAHLVTYYNAEDKKPKKCKFKTACNDEE